MAVSGNVHVDTTDIGCSNHFLVWVELGRAAKNSKKGKHVIRRWRLDRFGDDEVKLRYQNGLRAEVHGFSQSIKRKVEGGMKGHDLVNEVLREWESIVNRVAKREVGDKMIVCGRAARWWDIEINRRTKGWKENITSLKSDAGVSVTSTRGKLEVLQKHYQHLGKISVDSDFDANWKEEVESKVWQHVRVM